MKISSSAVFVLNVFSASTVNGFTVRVPKTQSVALYESSKPFSNGNFDISGDGSKKKRSDKPIPGRPYYMDRVQGTDRNVRPNNENDNIVTGGSEMNGSPNHEVDRFLQPNKETDRMANPAQRTDALDNYGRRAHEADERLAKPARRTDDVWDNYGNQSHEAAERFANPARRTDDALNNYGRQDKKADRNVSLNRKTDRYDGPVRDPNTQFRPIQEADRHFSSSRGDNRSVQEADRRFSPNQETVRRVNPTSENNRNDYPDEKVDRYGRHDRGTDFDKYGPGPGQETMNRRSDKYGPSPGQETKRQSTSSRRDDRNNKQRRDNTARGRDNNDRNPAQEMDRRVNPSRETDRRDNRNRPNTNQGSDKFGSSNPSNDVGRFLSQSGGPDDFGKPPMVRDMYGRLVSKETDTGRENDRN